MSHYIIEDWVGQHVYTDRTFTSFEDARAFISDIADKEAYSRYPEHMTGVDDERDEIYDGICDDLYAVEAQA